MKVFSVLIVILGLNSIAISFHGSGDDYITYIVLKFEHSKRIPYNSIQIEMFRRHTEFVVRIKSEPMDSSREFIYSRIDKTISIEKTQFNEIAEEVQKFSKIKLKKALTIGKDGTECSIEFGEIGNSVTYKFWTPDYDTKKRGLTHFLSVFRRILEIGGFKPDEIM